MSSEIIKFNHEDDFLISSINSLKEEQIYFLLKVEVFEKFIINNFNHGDVTVDYFKFRVRDASSIINVFAFGPLSKKYNSIVKYSTKNIHYIACWQMLLDLLRLHWPTQCIMI